MKLQNTFVQSKMNTDIDERLLPKGQYPFAENARVVNAGSSNMGAVENHLGNVSLTNFELIDAVTIGALADTSNQKIYFFITSEETDLVVEYDDLNSNMAILLQSSRPFGVLNFDKNYLITGVNKVINGDFRRDTLHWTDDKNPPRVVNIERAKTYLLDGFTEDDISVIKRPPAESPVTQFTYTPSTLENNLTERFLSFSYRYKYLDGEYSALSPFSYYMFSPKGFDLDYQTYENDGMVNTFNAINIKFDTGSSRVTDIQLVYKESNSNNIYLVETFNKKLKGWDNDEQQAFLFANSKIYEILPDDELYRKYDNVPRLAKAQEVIGNRIGYANYLEGYNLVDKFGEDIDMDYTVSLQTNDLTGVVIPYLLSSSAATNDRVTLNLSGISLLQGTRIRLQVNLVDNPHNGEYDNFTDFILNRDYADAQDLAEDDDFILFIETILTNNFINNYEVDVPADGSVESVTGFSIVSSTATTVTLSAPVVVFRIDGTPSIPDDPESDTFVNSFWSFTQKSSFFFKESAVDSSMKTNRSYEVGIEYADSYNRGTPSLTSQENTLYIPQTFSVYQNKLRVTLNHKAPYWADRFRFVVKQNKLEYQTIYTSVFYEDGLYRWVKLEGENKQKVREGDVLIVKSDLAGAVEDIIKVKVLEITTQPKDFIDNNELASGEPLKEAAGLYMKIKPEGIDMNIEGDAFLEFSGNLKRRYASRSRVFTSPIFGYVDDADVFQPYVVNAGSQIRVFVRSHAKGSISYDESFDKEYIVQDNYASIRDWFLEEVETLGQFGDDRLAEYGFTDDGSQFFVRSNRDGTASRDIMIEIKFEVLLSPGILIFETEPKDSGVDIFFEDAKTFFIDDIDHLGNIQNQNTAMGIPAIFELDMFNCFVMGNGAESNRIKDNFNVKYLGIDYRPTTTTVEKFRAVRRFADITYSAPYSENTNINGLSEFNLYKANFKEDIDKKYGSIQKLYSRDTDLVVFQEDKVSKVLYGKDLLMKADGNSDITSSEDVLGQQIPYTGEWGISRNPESFAYKGNALYFTDRKRGTPVRLDLNGISEINYGMIQYFKDLFKNTANSKQVGAFDPFYDQYVLSSGGENVYNDIRLDCSNTIVRQDFNGSLGISMDYGIQTGDAGFSYITNGVPIKFTLTWAGNTYTTGFVGDPSYNDELAALGFPPVSGSGTGTLTFEKLLVFPPVANIEVYSPFNDSKFELAGNCVVSNEVTVITIVANDASFEGLQTTNKYKWINGGYSSSYRNQYTLFNAGMVSSWDSVTGQQGSGFIPSNGSTMLMEAFSPFGNPSAFNLGGRFAYLLSENLYTEADIDEILSSVTYLESTEVNYDNGDILHRASWELPESFAKPYIYMIWDYKKLAITQNTSIRIYFDSSGSMDTTLAPLVIMRDTLLKDALLPIYNNDSDLYDEKVTVISNDTERTLRFLNMEGDTPEGNVIVLVFQDESEPSYHGSTISPRTMFYDADIAEFRGRLGIFPVNYYRGIIFQVNGFSVFKQLMQAVQNGTGLYLPPYGLSDREEVAFKYDVAGGSSPEYYLDTILEALRELGFNI